MPLHLWTGWSAATARYDAPLPVTALVAADWPATGWQLPTHRILLDSDPSKPMLLQITWALADLVTAFEAAGWQASQATVGRDPFGNRAVSSAAWTSRAVADDASFPLGIGDPHQDRRHRSAHGVAYLENAKLGARWHRHCPAFDGVADRLEPVDFGYTQLEGVVVWARSPDQLATEKAGLVAVLP